MKKRLLTLATVLCIAFSSVGAVSASSTASSWYLYYTNTNSGNHTYQSLNLVGAPSYTARNTERGGTLYETTVKIGSQSKQLYGAGSYRTFSGCAAETVGSVSLNYTSGGGSGYCRGNLTY